MAHDQAVAPQARALVEQHETLAGTVVAGLSVVAGARGLLRWSCPGAFFAGLDLHPGVSVSRRGRGFPAHGDGRLVYDRGVETALFSSESPPKSSRRPKRSRR